MSGRQQRPGDPYEVGFAKPPKRTRFKKGRLGNPNGRPRKKPDLYAELRRVLFKPTTVSIEGELQRVTVQQALLLRLRDQALRGEVWAGKLLQKVIDAIPDGGTQHDIIDWKVDNFRAKALLGLMLDESEREKARQNPDTTEAGHVD